jgi:putative addiction module component (TIGR02574 family)
MTKVVEQLVLQARRLSPAERAELVYRLLNTLEPEEEGAEEAWRAEIARRVAEIHSGQSVGRPLDEVLADLRARYP